MARVEWTQQALDDLDTIVSYLTSCSVGNASTKALEIFKAVHILEQNPLLGQAIQQGRRELAVGPRRRSYKVRYRYLPDIDMVFIVSVRSHKQA